MKEKIKGFFGKIKGFLNKIKAKYEKIVSPMRPTLKKIANVCKLIFGYGIMITLFVGGLTFFGYVVALIAGGDVGAAICTFIYKKIIPVMIYTSTVLVIFGLITMYIGGEKALTSSKKKKISKSEGER